MRSHWHLRMFVWSICAFKGNICPAKKHVWNCAFWQPRSHWAIPFFKWKPLGRKLVTRVCSNRPFPSSLVPLFQSESKCDTILMKMTFISMKMKLHAELIFIWKVSHLDSFWNRGTRKLGNGLSLFASFLFLASIPFNTFKPKNVDHEVLVVFVSMN